MTLLVDYYLNERQVETISAKINDSWLTSLDITIHPTAIVDEGAQIGKGCRFWHWVNVCAGARASATRWL